ncbi:MAG: 30S ribosome-binding factor RbfA [Lachnospiraceae bacterium]|nr:30S ribosome-binding factor RbfA [Lachnospiraceae bacterium]
MKKNSIKNTRINGEVKKELSHIIAAEIKDPRIHPMTSVTEAIVATDLKTCKVYISVLGGEEEKKNTIAGLKSAEGFIRRRLAATVNLRNTPELIFILDESIEYGMNMMKKIEEQMELIRDGEGEVSEETASDEYGEDTEEYGTSDEE